MKKVLILGVLAGLVLCGCEKEEPSMTYSNAVYMFIMTEFWPQFRPALWHILGWWGLYHVCHTIFDIGYHYWKKK